MQITITEALAEIKTIGKRLEKKREFVSAYLWQAHGFKDPLVNEGGSKLAIERERQAMRDLTERLVKIRVAISKANNDAPLTVGTVTRPILDWLIWRREVAPSEQQFFSTMRGRLGGVRNEARSKGVMLRRDESEATAPSDIIVNFDEKKFAEEAELLEKTLGELDGLLSLKNATTMIEIPD